jgi:hypothetical protein
MDSGRTKYKFSETQFGRFAQKRDSWLEAAEMLGAPGGSSVAVGQMKDVPGVKTCASGLKKIIGMLLICFALVTSGSAQQTTVTGVLTTPAGAPDPNGVLWLYQSSAPQFIALSADEQREAAAVKVAVEQAQAARGQAWQLIQQVPVTDCAKVTAAVSVAQQVEQRVATTEAQIDALLWRLRASHGCKECEYTPDRKALVRSKPQ